MSQFFVAAMVWVAMHTSPYWQEIAKNQSAVLARPLTNDELQTVREAMWNRQMHYVARWPDQIALPEPHAQVAFFHLLNGGPLRVHDAVEMHGMLRSALQPDTFALSRKWWPLMDAWKAPKPCVPEANEVEECIEY